MYLTTYSLTHSLTYSITQLTTYSLSHLTTYLLTHSLTHVTYSLIDGIAMDNITNNAIPLYHNAAYIPSMTETTNSKNKRSFNNDYDEPSFDDDPDNVDAMDTATNVGLVSEQIKRCRITTSAGEILLRKEMKKYDDEITNFSYSFTDEPNLVHLLFNDSLSDSVPNKFTITGLYLNLLSYLLICLLTYLQFQNTILMMHHLSIVWIFMATNIIITSIVSVI